MSDLDTTPISITLPVHVWAILRGAARRAARQDRRAADRAATLRTPGINLDAHRALVLEEAVAILQAALDEHHGKSQPASAP